MDVELLQQTSNITTLEECNTWNLKCDECLTYLREECRKNNRVGTALSIISRIACLETAQRELANQFIYIGAGYSNEKKLEWVNVDTAFQNRIITGLIYNTNYIDPKKFLEGAKDIILKQIRNIISEHGSIKINVVLNGEFVTGEKTDQKSIITSNSEIYSTTELNIWYMKYVIDSILASLEEFQERDSGWALSRILNLIVNINKHNPLHAGCHIQLPFEIASKKAVINVQSADNACFAWAVVAALYQVKTHSNRSSHYPHYSTVLNLNNITFPMTISQIKKFENQNCISINVFTKDEEKSNFIPLYLTSNKREKHVNLLYIVDSQNNAHFVWIKNLSRLLHNQINKHHGKLYICER